MTKLAEFDTSDMLGRTQKYCEGANPDPVKKREAFIALFENQNDMSLQHVQEMCRGFRQFGQRELIETFADEFFERIEDLVNNVAYSLTRFIYIFLQPSLNCTDEELARYHALKAKLEGYSEAEKKEGSDRLLKWVKDSI